MVQSNLAVSCALCAVVAREEYANMAKALVNMFQTTGNILDLIQQLIKHEIETTGIKIIRKNGINTYLCINFADKNCQHSHFL